MKIVAHNGATIWGGAERATCRLLAGLQSRGHEVLLLCNSPLVMEKAAELGIPSEQLVIAGDVLVHHALRVKRRLERIHPDAFIIGTYKKLFLASLGARLAGVPRIVARVGLQSDTPRSWKYRVALRKWTDAVVVNSAMMAEAFAITGFPESRIRVIHNGVNPLTRVMDKASARKALAVPENVPVIGTAARLGIQKRIDRLVEALAVLPENVYCVVAGEGTRRADIEALTKERNLSDRFRLLGQRDDVRDFLSALDVYVVSSDSEGLSNAMLEAMSLGVPVVSTDVSGARDALLAGNDSIPGGIIVKRDATAIAYGVTSLLQDVGLRDAMSAAAKERAAHLFSMDTMISEWEKLLSTRG